MTTLVRRRHPSLKTLNVLLEVQPFPGLEPESKFKTTVFLWVTYNSKISQFQRFILSQKEGKVSFFLGDMQ